MAHSGGRITAPIGVDSDVAPVLGTTIKEVGALCRSSLVNQWSKIKPVVFNTPAALTLGQMGQANYGMSISHDVNDVILSNNTLRSYPWTYSKPSTNLRITDFNGYYHFAVAPIRFTFPNQLAITGGTSASNLVSGIDAAFDDTGQTGWNSYSLSIKDVISASSLNYRFTVGILAKNSAGSVVTKWYVTDKKTIKERFDQRDYGTVDVDLNLKDAGITSGMTAQMIYFLSNNNIPKGQRYLANTACTSLEYLPNADRRTYTVKYISPTAGLTATIDFDLNSYSGTTFYVTRVHYKITKDSSYVPGLFYLDIQAELASVKWIWLKENIVLTFVGNVAEKTFTTAQLPSTNMFVMSRAERDQFSVLIRFNDPANSFTQVLADSVRDVNWP